MKTTVCFRLRIDVEFPKLHVVLGMRGNFGPWTTNPTSKSAYTCRAKADFAKMLVLELGPSACLGSMRICFGGPLAQPAFFGCMRLCVWQFVGSANAFWLYAPLCLVVCWLRHPFFGSMRICFWWFAGSATVFWQHARLFLVIRWLHPCFVAAFAFVAAAPLAR